MMKKALFSIVLVLLFCGMPGQARAALDQAGAERLKQVFTDYLERRKTAMRFGGQELRAEGAIMVEPGDYYYAVTMPHLSVHNPDGSYTDIGILAINAMPGDTPREWKMTIAIPTPVLAYDADKKIESRIDIGAQTLAGVWSEDMRNFTKLDARYENLSIQRIQEKYAMEQMEIVQGGDPGVSKIGRVELNGALHEYSPENARAYEEKLVALQSSAGETPGPEHVESLYNTLFDAFSSLWDGFDSTMTVSDIALSRPAIPGSPAGSLTIAKAGMGMNARGFRSDSVSASMKIFYDGFKIAPVPAGFGAATPDHLNIDVSLSKLPFREIVEMRRAEMKAVPAGAEPTTAQTAALMTKALQLMTRAGTSFTVKDSALGNTTYNALLNGQALADLEAAMKAVGSMRLEVSGLDRLIALSGEKLKDKTLDDASRKTLQDSVVLLTVLQTLGQMGKNGKGEAVRVYDFALAKDGKMTLNGTDLAAIQAVIGAAREAGKK
ncbi:MAG: hypothetical protein HYU57_03555 [Micavibrio aeruginosavorus]|nr:hypothetical protein [Micavibrio aeruginosavorus]